jgi:transcriptional regulator with XRE-family HTH domain
MLATIGSRIKARRVELHLSRFELGTLCELDSLHIYRWETGRCVPNLKSVVSLARGLRMSLDRLVLGRESRYRSGKAPSANGADSAVDAAPG